MEVPNTKNKAFEDGVLTRANGYNRYFNPFLKNKENPLYRDWLNGWINQNILMTK